MSFGFKWDPILRRSFSDASLVLGVAPYVKDLLKDVPIKRFEVLLQTGIHELPALAEKRCPTNALKLLYVGRIVRTKGLIYAIRAVAMLRDLPGISLDVVGAGDDRAACEADAVRLGVADRIVFHGWIKKNEVNRFYQEADLFVFPSLREPSGQVVLEAMSHGLPLIVCNSGGPGHTVQETFGHRIPVTTPTELSAGIAKAIRDLHGRRDTLREMSETARQEIADKYLWSAKIEKILEFYRSTVEKRTN